ASASPFCISFCFLHPPRSPLFPYTTLFRSIPIRIERLAGAFAGLGENACLEHAFLAHCSGFRGRIAAIDQTLADLWRRSDPGSRSEEQTSELQSHLNLVCRLLLEKKKENQE